MMLILPHLTILAVGSWCARPGTRPNCCSKLSSLGDYYATVGPEQHGIRVTKGAIEVESLPVFTVIVQGHATASERVHPAQATKQPGFENGPSAPLGLGCGITFAKHPF